MFPNGARRRRSRTKDGAAKAMRQRRTMGSACDAGHSSRLTKPPCHLPGLKMEETREQTVGSIQRESGSEWDNPGSGGMEYPGFGCAHLDQIGRGLVPSRSLASPPARPLCTTPMSATTIHDDPELPPPSAQPNSIQHQTSRARALDPGNSSHARTSGVPRRDARPVSHRPRVATHDAVDRSANSCMHTHVAVDHSASSRMHTHRTPSAIPSRTSMKPRPTPTPTPTPAPTPAPASQTAAKPSPFSAHPPPLLTSGVPSAARTFFDPWNSSSTGHQRAENRLSGSTSWRQSRSLKLAEQYKGGLGGGKRVADTVGAGSAEFGQDGRLANGGWEKGARGLRTGGQKSLAEVWGKTKASTAAKRSSQDEQHAKNALPSALLSGTEEMDMHHECERRHHSTPSRCQRPATEDDSELPPDSHHLSKAPAKHIFRGLCFYINGSTMPAISDHKLKYVLDAHGATQSIALGRRTVTHVILGTTCGGGLAGSKLQKEIARTRGAAVKYVSVEWYVL
ncbi:hypothetical protein PMIN06_013063, partial [Paraphaeosphaeria minitans]